MLLAVVAAALIAPACAVASPIGSTRIVAVSVPHSVPPLKPAPRLEAPQRAQPAPPAAAWVSHGAPVLSPLAHVRFCMQNPDQCRVVGRSIRRSPLRLTAARLAQLEMVNRGVNRSIVERPDVGPDTWTLAPRSGDCDDYAVTKRAELLRMGWPSRALLLAHVNTAAGQSHLVLVARTAKGDFVLDNLTRRILRADQTRFSWRRIQTAADPNMWSEIPREPLVAQRGLRLAGA